MAAALYVGVMSGTSADGIDACLASFRRAGPRVLAGVHRPFDAALRTEVLAVARGDALARAAHLDVYLADAYADAVAALLQAAGVEAGRVRAIGCHGQTVLHRPAGPAPTSIQLGDPHRLAARTGIDVVADFRRADIAAGGQGAPLAPAFHATAFRARREPRAVVNIGGIANLTWLPPGRAPIHGFDTGPGNVLLDAWCARHREEPYDADGAWAASGAVQAELLERLLAEPYFEQPPPKSTGREHFDIDWLERALAELGGDARPADVQATLVELTARTIAAAVAACEPPPARVLVCGGGARNAALMARLARALPDAAVETTAARGIAPEQVEAVAFAWLARRRIQGLPGNRPEVTGAARPVVLGSLTKAPRTPSPGG